MLPDVSPEAAMQIAERIRTHIAETVLVGEPPMAITASFGIAWLSAQIPDLDALQSAADAALYHAKRNGRNLVELSVTV